MNRAEYYNEQEEAEIYLRSELQYLSDNAVSQSFDI